MKSKLNYFNTNCRFGINKMICRVISATKMSTVVTVLCLSKSINWPYHSIPDFEIPFQFNNHTTNSIIIFKTHIMLLELNHILTIETKQVLNICRNISSSSNGSILQVNNNFLAFSFSGGNISFL